jgi:hypothetical protein
MANGLFREKSLKYISSPEQIDDYLKVTKPAVWAVLLAVVVLLSGLLVWASFAYIGSSIDGTAAVEGGTIVMNFDSQDFASNVREGMKIRIGETEWPITSVGQDDSGIFAVADTTLSDGTYKASVTYRKTQVLGLLFDN